MGIHNLTRQDQEYAQRLINNKVVQLLRKPCFWRDDPDDLEQELSVFVFLALRKYQPERGGLENYVTRVVNNAAAKLIDARMAQKRRTWRGSVSMEDLIENENSDVRERHGRIDQHEYFRWTGRDRDQESELVILCIDVSLAEASLPPNLRDLCRRLRGDRVAEIARDTGVSRASIYESIQKIRKQFRDLGLGDYL